MAIPLYARPAPANPEAAPCLFPFPLPAAERPRAAIVILPGGGYNHLAAHEGEPIARWANSLGLAAFVLHYRVSPHRHPAPLCDALRAIRMVRHRAAEYHIDPNRIAILGFSAGGHLAASAATLFDHPTPEDDLAHLSARPDAAVLCYPVISFGEHRHDGSMRNLLGDSPDAAQQQALSLEHRVTPRTPPTFLWHTAEDAAVPVENALLFAGACRRHRVPVELHVFPAGHHGLGLAADHPAGQWTSLAANFLRRFEAPR